jgi:hypothetical protein
MPKKASRGWGSMTKSERSAEMRRRMAVAAARRQGGPPPEQPNPPFDKHVVIQQLLDFVGDTEVTPVEAYIIGYAAGHDDAKR